MRVEIVIEGEDVTVSGPRRPARTREGQPGQEQRFVAEPSAPSETAAAGAINAGPAPVAPRGTAEPTINVGASTAGITGPGVGGPDAGLSAGAAPSAVDQPTEMATEEAGSSVRDEDEEE